MKILLTGYKGFIGQNFLEFFNRLENKSNFEIQTFTWGEEFPSLLGFDWVIHLGAVSKTTASFEEAYLKNYLFSIFLYKECKKFNVNLQFSSSASVYGNKNTTFKETDVPNPQSFYALSKYLFEDYVKNDENKNIVVQCFRYFNVYGKYEDHKGNMASPYHQFYEQAKNTGIIKIFDGEEAKRDFIHVQDVVKTQLRFLNYNESGVWNIGSGETKTFREVAEEIKTKISAEIQIIEFPEHLKKQYQRYTKADMTKINKVKETIC